MTKVQQYSKLQQHKISPKITGPCCRASTHSQVAIYNNNLTNTKKHTMTPLPAIHTLCYKKVINKMQLKKYL